MNAADAGLAPVPAVTVNPAGRTRALLVCEHASNTVPAAWGALGLAASLLESHIAVDIGAGPLTHRLAQLLDAPAVLCGCSRLVVDCNRGPGDPSWICAASDAMDVPGNHAVDACEAARRAAAVHHPFHRAVEQRLDAWRMDAVAHRLLAIHSFTPALSGGAARPWHVGVVWRDPALALPLLAQLRARDGLVVGDNEPYDGRKSCGYTIARHAEPFATPALAIEVRQDQLGDAEGIERWACLLADCLAPLLEVTGWSGPTIARTPSTIRNHSRS